MTGPVRIGVVGVGALSLRGILPHLTATDVRDRVQVQALCDPVQYRARASAALFGVQTVYASIEELLEDDAIDAVTIASPIGLHFEHCRLALEAGRHVHVNKTLCTTVAEADALIALANEKGLALVPSPGEILRPQLRRARELIDEGAIGHLSWAICGARSAAITRTTSRSESALPAASRSTPRGTSASRAAARCTTSPSTHSISSRVCWAQPEA